VTERLVNVVLPLAAPRPHAGLPFPARSAISKEGVERLLKRVLLRCRRESLRAGLPAQRNRVDTLAVLLPHLRRQLARFGQRGVRPRADTGPSPAPFDSRLRRNAQPLQPALGDTSGFFAFAGNGTKIETASVVFFAGFAHALALERGQAM
jgi:hypothetical protein